MIRKLTIISILVIVLVSINWFRDLLAADLSSATNGNRRQPVEQLDNSNVEPVPTPSIYATPELFDTNEPNSDKLQETHSGQKLESAPSRKSSQLAPFGHELFRGGRGGAAPSEIAAADDYILGPGDHLIVSLWGRADKQYNLTVDREGKVFVPEVGEILAWGLTLDKFSESAERHFSRVFSEFELTVSLGKIRSIRVYLTGEVVAPGAYTVSSLTSMFDAVYDAGGPNERGSMRRIQLKRQGKLVAEVDLYRLLLEGDNGSDIRLKTGDVIFVPVAGARVAVSGEVNRPAIYELKDPLDITQILELAGKPTARARLERVMLERIGGDQEWKIFDIDLSAAPLTESNNPILQDGDRVTIQSIFDLERNRAGVFGHVRHPGYYEKSDTTRVSDLIRLGKLRPFDTYFDRADLFRHYEDSRVEIIPINLTALFSGDDSQDLCIEEMDSLHIYSTQDIHWASYVYIEGEIRKPGKYPLYENMSVADLIFLAGSLEQEAAMHRSEVARLDSVGEVTITYLALDDGSAERFTLKENDHVYIRQIPNWQLHPTVSIEGEVQYPGKYMLSDRSETLYGLLQRSGGFTTSAFPSGIVVERETIEKNLERVRIGQLINRSQPLVRDSMGVVRQEGVYEISSNSLNRIIIDMKEVLATEGKRGDIVLEPNDRIFVPAIPSGISVLGAVGANGTLKFEEKSEVKSYVKKAGGFTRRADKGEVRLIRANGEIISGKSALNTRAELGDIVFIPSKIEKERNWFKNFATTMSAITGILTSVYIVSKI